MRFNVLAVFAAATVCLPCTAQPGDVVAKTANGVSTTSTYIPVQGFDEKRDAVADIQAAISEAQRTHKRILIYVGGNWCPYCEQIHELFRKNPELLQLRDAHFITVPVAYGYGNSKEQALSSYTKVLGIPHFFVLESDGHLLQSQHLVELRDGGDYDAQKMREFLNRWSRPEAAVQVAKKTSE
jgi:thioredoxin-related protein